MNTVTSNTGFILRHGSFADGVNVEICILFRGGIQIKILMRCHLIRNQNEHLTARKRSLGQGNVFKPVCHSVHMGCSLLSMHHRSHDQGGLHLGRSASRGVGRPPEVHGILQDTVNKRAVRILLECILVLHKI